MVPNMPHLSIVSSLNVDLYAYGRVTQYQDKIQYDTLVHMTELCRYMDHMTSIHCTLRL